ncbi:uncharacterized protein LOC128736023 [Sabethes cyaneus]|uniref:uncharacterized protein LOC128736023 n=1 Tax=Sabethes cyaneus TaxID=53552 RepID=UPI00237EC7E9|nr:uncharacterized protein LOC128736023 [Sabethes cyaneus]
MLPPNNDILLGFHRAIHERYFKNGMGNARLAEATALHWAAKHGSKDVVKLVAGTLKADVNARTNGGYTALHIAMQFGRNDIFELLCNVYKADRDLLDWSGKKPLEYQKQMTSVSASTYSSEYDPMFVVNERFHSLPSKKILSPLARGGTFMRKKSRRQRPSTTTGLELQRTHSMLTVVTPEQLSLATNIRPVPTGSTSSANGSGIYNRDSLTAQPSDTMSLISGSTGNIRRNDKTNQSFFRRKKTQTLYQNRRTLTEERPGTRRSKHNMMHCDVVHTSPVGMESDLLTLKNSIDLLLNSVALKKIKARKKHTEKDSGFLRIGSLNVRVKRTTEAFSNFLGVGTNTTRLPQNMRTSAPPNSAYFEKLHKSWGSADNIPHEDNTMPPPKYGSVKKRRPKQYIEYELNSDHHSQSVPTTPSQPRAPIGTLSENQDTESENPGDSDSDTACGFDSNWRPTYI